MLKTWLKRFGKTLSKHYMVILLTVAMISSFSAFVVTMFDAAYWKIVAATPEPEWCAVEKYIDFTPSILSAQF